MTHSESVSAFIACILLSDPNPAPVTPIEMAYNINAWIEDGVEIPEDMTAIEAAETYNAFLLSGR